MKITTIIMIMITTMVIMMTIYYMDNNTLKAVNMLTRRKNCGLEFMKIRARRI